MQYLVGVAEIASALNVSKQRADQLTRTRGFLDPIDKVLVVDALTEQALLEYFDDRASIATAERTMELFEKRAFRLPAQPRLWRLSVIQDWATETGRQWHDIAQAAAPNAASAT